MGILRALKASWKAASTAEKMHLVLDIVCGIGCAIITNDVEKQILPGHNRFEKACMSTVATGLGLAAGTAASNALMDNYGNAIAAVIDKRRNKEENTDGE